MATRSAAPSRAHARLQAQGTHREDERIAAGYVTRAGAPSRSRPARTATIDEQDINVISR